MFALRTVYRLTTKTFFAFPFPLRRRKKQLCSHAEWSSSVKTLAFLIVLIISIPTIHVLLWKCIFPVHHCVVIYVIIFENKSTHALEGVNGVASFIIIHKRLHLNRSCYFLKTNLGFYLFSAYLIIIDQIITSMRGSGAPK